MYLIWVNFNFKNLRKNMVNIDLFDLNFDLRIYIAMKILLNLLMRSCLTISLLLGTVAFSWSADMEKGLAAAQSGDFATALREWKPLAEQGDAAAQNNLGLMYEKGLGVTQDFIEAMKWYRKAAEQGDADAQYNLGVMYDNGRGVTQDYAEAVNWYRKAAEQGYAFAQTNLGFMYDKGRGVIQDYKEAIKWYRKAAEQGDAKAQYNLGFMYDNGQGVAQDYAEAVNWYRKAAEQGDAKAQNNLGSMYDNGQGVAKDDKQAANWYRKAADQGTAMAQYNLGVMYANGQGVAKDVTEAARLFQLAADQGNADANAALIALKESALAESNEQRYQVFREFKNWTIVHDTQNPQSCLAGAKYQNGTIFDIGMVAPNGAWSLEISNPKWKSIEPGQSYEITYIFDQRRSWTGEDNGIENGLRSNNIKEEFVRDYARSSSLQIMFNGNEIDRFSLRGTRKATDAVKECFKQRIKKKDPFTSDDPFASKDPFTTDGSLDADWIESSSFDIPELVEKYATNLEEKCAEKASNRQAGLVLSFISTSDRKIYIVDGHYTECGGFADFCGTGGCPTRVFMEDKNGQISLLFDGNAHWVGLHKNEIVVGVHGGQCSGSGPDPCHLKIDVNSGTRRYFVPEN